MARDLSSARGTGTGKAGAGKARSLAVAVKGIATANDFASMMSALMSDLIDGRVTPQVGNAVSNAGGKLLKVVELQHKYGTAGNGKPDRNLKLVTEEASKQA